jgi:hypothetical protein
MGLDGTSYYRMFMMLKLLPYPAKHPTTHTLDSSYGISLLVLGDEFSMVSYNKERGMKVDSHKYERMVIQTHNWL